jgi:carbamoyl-phosphate synthase large subunit
MGMSEDFNILITAASRRIALIRGFKRALADSPTGGKVWVTDYDRMAPGLRFADGYDIAPLSSSENYIPTLLDICRKRRIKMIIPSIDEELPLFGRHKKDFMDIGVIPLVSDERVGLICNDKSRTAAFFAGNGFPFAKTFHPDEVDPDSATYPLFIKPRSGRGSIGAHSVKDANELRFFRTYVADPVVQEYLEGREYTIDVLAGLDGRILSVVPRERLVIRSGVSDKAKTHRSMKLIGLCKTICERLGVVGPVNMQCKVNNGKITFFEINPRFSGAIQLTIASGADFFTMIVAEGMGQRPKPVIGDFKDNLLMLSYEDSLFELNGAAAIPSTSQPVNGKKVRELAEKA